jgi:hypothetical protein
VASANPADIARAAIHGSREVQVAAYPNNLNYGKSQWPSLSNSEITPVVS